jgi:hypothetical protein
MDLKKMGYEYNKEKLYDFAFVGVVRKSKGLMSY